MKNTTAGISAQNDVSTTQEKPGLTDLTLMGLVGFIIFNSAELAGLFGGMLNTAQTAASQLDFALVRFVALLFGALTYIFLRNFSKRDVLVHSAVCIIVATAFQLLLTALALIDMYARAMPLIISIVAWALWGIAHSFLYCAWVDTKGSLDDEVASKTNLWAFCATAALVTVILCLPQEVGLYLLIGMLVLSSVFLLIDRAEKPLQENEDCDDDTIDKNLTSKDPIDFEVVGSYNLIIIGVIISFSAGLLITGAFVHGFPVACIGVALMLTTLIFGLVRRFCPAALAFGTGLRVLFPVAIGGLAFMTFLRGPVIEVISFMLFSFLYMIDLANLSNLSMRGNILGISPTLCFSKGRIYIVLGQALGWLAVVVFYASYPDIWLRPYITAILLTLIAVYIMLGAIGELRGVTPQAAAQLAPIEEVPEPSISVPEEDIAKHQPYKTRCMVASQQYDLTQREAEILTYLARGRNAKYIAQQLFVAERTVKTHAYHIYQKMNIHSQQELIDIVEKLG